MGAMVHDAYIGAVTLSQCSQAGYASNTTIESGFASGGITPEAKFLTKAEPVATWTTSDIASVIAGIDLETGLCLSSATISIPWATQNCGGATGSGHTVISGSNGFAVIQSITARQGETAIATVECCFLSTNGFLAPTSASSGSLTSAAFVGEYTLSAVSVNSTSLTGVTGFTVSPNVAYEKRYTNGGIYPTHIFLGQVVPHIDITFENQAYASTYGPLFAAMSSASCSMIKRLDGGALDEDTVAVSFGGGIISMETISGQGRTPAEVTLRLHGLSLAGSA